MENNYTKKHGFSRFTISEKLQNIETPHLIVTKKNVTPLEKITEWINPHPKKLDLKSRLLSSMMKQIMVQLTLELVNNGIFLQNDLKPQNLK